MIKEDKYDVQYENLSILEESYVCPATGAISTQICKLSTFTFDDFQKPKEHDYIRTSNYTRKALEEGNAEFACASRMAAITTISPYVGYFLIYIIFFES